MRESTMSKMDGLRAMREARYEAARKGTTAATPRPKAAPAATSKSTKAPAATTGATEGATDAATDELCGHKAISGRTCTREKGHAAKSHRYA